MHLKKLSCLAALAIAARLSAATPQFLLGIDYSESLPPNVSQVAADGSGNIYVLSGQSALTKLTPDGRTVLWQAVIGYSANLMAVDSGGNVYVLAYQSTQPAVGTLAIQKFDTTGHPLWTWDSSPSQGIPTGFAVDTLGRPYVTTRGNGFTAGFAGSLLRINAVGNSVDYNVAIPALPTSLAIANDGSAFVAGLADHSVLFLTRYAPDGSPGFFSTTAGKPDIWPAVAVDSNGSEVLFTPGQFQRFDGNGALTLTKTVPSWDGNMQSVLVDSAGNAYIAGSTNGIYPVVNSLATCGTQMLSVVGRDGTILQTTYLPGGATIIASSPNSGVLLAGVADSTYSPSQPGPFPAGGSLLLHLSPNLNADVLPLACIGNAATYLTGSVAPGEIVTLTGSGLGPVPGIQTQASFTQPFPTAVQNVQVTFDGKPAPLLWVQDSQINAIAPWSLTPGQNTRVCVLTGATTTNCLTKAVAQTSPGVFTIDGYYAAALNQNGTVNSAANPAKAGSIVTVFATGLGPITPAQNDGTLVNLPLPSNTLGAQLALSGFPSTPSSPKSPQLMTVTYAGPAPYLVAGASQINFQVTKSSYPFMLSAGGGVAAFYVYVAP